MNQNNLCNLEAEQGLIGSILADPLQFVRVNEIVRAEHFFAPAHQRIWREIEKAIFAGKRPTAVLLKAQIEGDITAAGDFEPVGGAGKYLIDLYETSMGGFNAADYAAHIADMALRRNASSALQDGANKLLSFHDNTPSGLLLDQIENDLINLRRQSDPGTEQDADAAYQSTLRWMEDVRNGKIKRIMTGFSKLDEITAGLIPGALYVLGGRPSMGKTALALNIAENIAATAPVLFFSLEMTAAELTMRIAARRTGIGLDKQQKPERLAMDEVRKLIDVKMPGNLRVDDRSGLAVEQIISRARAFARGKKPSLIIVDHLHLIAMDHKLQMVHAIGRITQALKTLAKDLDCPVMLLTQLNRALENREEKRPVLADLRDSGSIEQDSNVVMFVHRQEYYHKREHPKTRKASEKEEDFKARVAQWYEDAAKMEGQCEVIIAKNRSGICDTAYMKFDGKAQNFTEA